MTFITRTKIGNKLFGAMSDLPNRTAIKTITIPEHRTNGEEFILVKDIDYCKIILDQNTTEHIVIKIRIKKGVEYDTFSFLINMFFPTRFCQFINVFRANSNSIPKL
jgi:hypothetical protein